MSGHTRSAKWRRRRADCRGGADVKSFSGSWLADLRLPVGTLWLAEALGECKGRQALYERQSPQILKALLDLALVESAESSNRSRA